MARKKVVYEVTIRKHTVIDDDGTENKIQKEVQRQADNCYYMNSDTCTAEVISVADMD